MTIFILLGSKKTSSLSFIYVQIDLVNFPILTRMAVSDTSVFWNLSCFSLFFFGCKLRRKMHILDAQSAEKSIRISYLLYLAKKKNQQQQETRRWKKRIGIPIKDNLKSFNFTSVSSVWLIIMWLEHTTEIHAFLWCFDFVYLSFFSSFCFRFFSLLFCLKMTDMSCMKKVSGNQIYEFTLRNNVKCTNVTNMS